MWIDSDRIQLADDWMQRIRSAIDEARAVLFLVSEEALRSEVCEQEIQWALDSGKRLVPVLVEGMETSALPDVLKPYHAIRLANDQPGASNGLVDQIRDALDQDPAWVELHTRLLVAARGWRDAGEPVGALISSTSLTEAEQAVAVERAAAQPQPATLVREFLVASRAHQRRRRNRIGLGVTVAAAAVALVGLVALDQRSTAEVAQQTATAESERADLEGRRTASRALVQTASGLASTDTNTAALLAAAAWEVSPDRASQLGMVEVAAELGDLERLIDVGFDADSSKATDQGVAISSRTSIAFIFEDGSASESLTLQPDSEGRRPSITDVGIDGTYLLVQWFGADDFVPEQVGLVDVSTGETRWRLEVTAEAGLIDGGDGNTVYLIEGSFSDDSYATPHRVEDGAESGQRIALGFGRPHGEFEASENQIVSSTPAWNRNEVQIDIWLPDGEAQSFPFASPAPEGHPSSADAEGIYYLRSLAQNVEADVLAMAHSDGSVTIFEGNSTHEGFFGHDGGTTDLAISPTGETVVSVGDDGSLALWDSSSGALLETRPAVPAGNGQSIDFVNQNTVAVVSTAGVQLRSIASGPALLTSALPLPGGEIDPSGEFIASTTSSSITIRRAENGEVLAEAGAEEASVSWAGQVLIVLETVGDGALIRTGRWEPGRTEIEWSEFEGPADIIGAHLAGDAVALRTLSGRLTLHDPASGAITMDTPWLDGDFWLASATTDSGGQYLAAHALFDGGGLLRLWSLSAQPVESIELDVWAPISYVFSSGSTHLATSDWNEGTQIHELDQGGSGLLLSGRSLFALAFSPDGSVLAGADREQLTFWDVASGQELLSLSLSLRDEPRSIAIAQDLASVTVTSDDTVLRIELAGEEIQDRLCGITFGEIPAQLWSNTAPSIVPVDPCAGS